MDTMENDLTKRTHTIMMDALRETLPDADTNLLELSNENLDNLSSSSIGSTSNEEMLSIKSKEIEKNKPDPLESLGIWSNEEKSSQDADTLKADTSNGKQTMSNGLGSLLLDFGDQETSSGPALPVKKRQYERVSSAFTDEPLIDLAIDNMGSDHVKRQESTNSLIGGTGGLNAILQNAVVPSPTAVKNVENPWSPIEKKEDPWRISEVKEEKEEVAHAQGFENDFKVASSERKSPSQSRTGSVESNYAEYAERVKKSPGLKKKFGIDLPSFGSNNQNKDEDKITRKKSQGAWLKDKLSTIGRSVRAGGQQASNNTSSSTSSPSSTTIKKSEPLSIGEAVIDAGGIKAPTSPRGTPMEASERSKKKSLSVIPKSSLDEGTFLSSF